ncbi:hypothetical protein Tco_0858732 [Tanacetum coccineum]|uniref:Uncharacterized protein n=1 Tax=Tanacetum coccineum TaxID=301880 RepID=A0ABQ5BA40_9ASTR
MFPTEEELAYHKELLDLGNIIDSSLSEVVLGKTFAQASKLACDESLGLIRKFLIENGEEIFIDAGDGVRIYPDGVASPAMLYLTRRSLEDLRKFYWMILGGRFNQLSHVYSPLLSKPVEY